MRIIYLPKFERAYKNLPENIKDQFEQIENILFRDPFDPRLHLHKLKGEFAGFWAFSVGYKYRVICEFYDIGALVLYTIGTHKIYQ